jgi:geranylgeranyl diphosphate synthase type I
MIPSARQRYKATFGPILTDIEAEMRAVRQEQTEVAPLLWEVIDYQFGWDLDEQQRQKVSGKRIRPLLMALVAQAVTGSYRHVLPAGVALEMIHNFTLIHDDVMDKSLTRRHRPAVWTRWGADQAINSGDGLYALANLASARLMRIGTPPEKVVRVFEWLSRACLNTAEGQILDMDFESRESVSTADYITMIANKSATLIEFAAGTGALLSTDDEAVIDAYAQFARNLGVAFQVRDDYLGVWGNEATTGKSASSDIREKKKSYPVLAAFEQAVDDDRATLRRLYAQDSLSDSDIDTVLAILDRCDAGSQTDAIAQTYYDAAMQHLDATGIQNDTQTLIRQFAAFLIQRAY